MKAILLTNFDMTLGMVRWESVHCNLHSVVLVNETTGKGMAFYGTYLGEEFDGFMTKPLNKEEVDACLKGAADPGVTTPLIRQIMEEKERERQSQPVT